QRRVSLQPQISCTRKVQIGSAIEARFGSRRTGHGPGEFSIFEVAIVHTRVVRPLPPTGNLGKIILARALQPLAGLRSGVLTAFWPAKPTNPMSFHVRGGRSMCKLI